MNKKYNTFLHHFRQNRPPNDLTYKLIFKYDNHCTWVPFSITSGVQILLIFRVALSLKNVISIKNRIFQVIIKKKPIHCTGGLLRVRLKCKPIKLDKICQENIFRGKNFLRFFFIFLITFLREFFFQPNFRFFVKNEECYQVLHNILEWI